jgi:protein-S-isoprenylcysteine O-methyltransferase Ste14
VYDPEDCTPEDEDVTRWGIGPKWTLASVACVAPFVVAGRVWPGLFDIEVVPAGVRIVAGCLLLAVGIPFMVTALRTLHRGFPRGELFTRGVYGCCRHPIYASWIVFLVPGMLLLWGSWAFAIAPAVMYVLLRFFVRDEDTWLEQTFQDRYRAYRRSVPAVLPLPRFWRPRDEA